MYTYLHFPGRIIIVVTRECCRWTCKTGQSAGGSVSIGPKGEGGGYFHIKRSSGRGLVEW